MRAGRSGWTSKVPSAELQAIHDALDSGVGTAASVYRRLNVQRYCRGRSFREYAARRQREQDARRASSSPPSPSSPSAETLVERLLTEIANAINSGDVPGYALPQVLKSVLAVQEVDIKQQAEQRAEELHAAKMATLRQAVKEASKDGHETVTYGAVVDMIDKVMRGEAA